MDDHDPPARGDVEMMGGGGLPKPTVRVSGEMDDAPPAPAVVIEIPTVSGNHDASLAIGNPGAATSSSARVPDPKPAEPEKSVQKYVRRKPPPPKELASKPRPPQPVPKAEMAPEPRPPPPTSPPPRYPADSGNSEVSPPDRGWTDSMRRELDRHSTEATLRRRYCCIYEIPDSLRQRAEDPYAPLVIKLGPLPCVCQYGIKFGPFPCVCHCQYGIMKAMQEQKWCYLQEALRTTGNVAKGLEILYKEIKELEPCARDCYSENLDHIDSNEFVRMMMLDGCFILQILLKETKRRGTNPDDPIFHQRWLFHKVKRDLLLLRYQIPFFVLERLFDQLKPSMKITDSLREVVYHFFKDRIKGAPNNVDAEPKHLLDLLHSNLFPKVDASKDKPLFTNLKPFHGAAYLQETGVEFESSRTDRLDITFKGGILKIPHFSIQDHTKSLFLNLTAFEQLHPRSHPHVTAYTFFMHSLINTAEDVSILRRKGVIDNWLGSDQEVADLFAELGRDITIYPNEVYMANVIEGIHDHCSKRINAWRGSFIHNYVRKPWGIVSLIAAIILLILTSIQAFFAMYSYFRPPSPSSPDSH